MHSADDSRELFRAMFPDSTVAEKFSLGRTKASYIINYGLAEFFVHELEDKLKSTESFIICFDESLNCRWISYCDILMTVQTRPLESISLLCSWDVLLQQDLLAKFKEGTAVVLFARFCGVQTH